MSELNAEIKTAIDSFDMDRARELLRDALKDPNAETYYLASKAAIDDEQKREFLEKTMGLDPFHKEANLALKKLNVTTTGVDEKQNPTREKEDRRQRILDLEHQIRQINAEIQAIEAKLKEVSNRKNGAIGLGFIGFFLVVALIGIVVIIVALNMYNNANKEQQELEAQRQQKMNQRLELERLLAEAKSASS